MSKVYYRATQVEYGMHPSQLEVGTRVSYLDTANVEFTAEEGIPEPI
jgi:hypothetical protein